MKSRIHNSPNLIYSVGTQVVALKQVQGSGGEAVHPAGAVGVVVMALKGNPNILECLYTPLVEHATPLARELLDMRHIFLSRLVYQTYNGYVMSQFKRMQADVRNQGKVKPKHVMHLIRLLLSGIHVLREGFVPVDVGQHRERLLAIKNEQLPWEEIEAWRRHLHEEFDRALAETKLPERPDYERANEFLVRARRLAVAEELP